MNRRKRRHQYKRRDEYCVLTHTPSASPKSVWRWSLEVYSWPTGLLAPHVDRAGVFTSREEATVVGVAKFGRVWRVNCIYSSVWSAYWPMTSRENAAPAEVFAAEEAWRSFVSGLEDSPV